MAGIVRTNSDKPFGTEYFLFYEFTTESVNHLPENDEYVSYIFISYFVEENMMIVNEYDCNN